MSSHEEPADNREQAPQARDDASAPATPIDAAARQRREFLRKLTLLGLAHFGIAYVGNAPHALGPAPVFQPDCGTLDAGGEVIQDVDCGLPSTAPARDADCGKLSETNFVSPDNACGLIKANGTRHADLDCGKIDGGNYPSPDQDCGLTTGSSAGGYLVDSACGKQIGTAQPPIYNADFDCGKAAASNQGFLADQGCGLVGAGSSTHADHDCGRQTPAGGPDLQSDSDCGLTAAYGTHSDSDCGIALTSGGATETDQDCMLPSPFPGVNHIDNH